MRLVGFILRHKLIFTGLLILTGLLLHYLLFTMPNAQAVAYTAKMQPGIASVKELFNKVAETSNLPLFSDPDIPLSEKQNQLAFIADINQKTIVALEHLSSDASQFGPPIIFPSSEYRQAAEVKGKLLPVIGQSQEALRNYGMLVDFLAYNYGIQARLQPHFGQNGALSEASRRELKQESQKLASFQVPFEFKELQDKLVKNLEKMAANNQSMASMQAENQLLGYELFEVVAKPSQTLQSVVELPEKLQSNNL